MNRQPDDALLSTLIAPAIKHAIRSQDPDEFRRWMHHAMAANQRANADLLPADPERLRRMASGMARALWNVIPLPRNGYRPDPLPPTSRNDPCPCGSGRKFKHCCLDLERAAPTLLSTPQVWPIAIEVLNRKQIEEAIALKRVPLEALVGHAIELQEQGRASRAVPLLEPFFEPVSRIDEVADHAFDTLCTLYDHVGKPERKMALIARVLQTAPRSPLRAGAWARLAAIRSDRGEQAGAWEAFHAAQRDSSGDPTLGILETQLLIAEGRTTEARERARFWRVRVERGRDPDAAGLTEWFSEVERDPHRAMASVALESAGDRQHVLLQWVSSLAARPLPEYTIVSEASDEPAAGFDSLSRRLRDMGVPQSEIDEHRADFERRLEALVPDGSTEDEHAAHGAGEPAPELHLLRSPPAVHAVERKWAEIVPFAKPFSVHNTPSESGGCWEPDVVARWTEVLSTEPTAADSVTVLDDVATALEMHALAGQPSFSEELLRPILERVVAILEAARSRHAGMPRLAWFATENRPALRSLARLHHVHACADRDTEALRIGQRLLELNPDDNHAMRAVVINALLRAAREQEALAVAARYPDDGLPETSYGRALALFRLGRIGEATTALRESIAHHSNIPRYLLALEIRKPRLDPMGITMGGKDQAWVYREEMRECWAGTAGALEWLAHIARQVRPSTARSGKRPAAKKK